MREGKKLRVETSVFQMLEEKAKSHGLPVEEYINRLLKANDLKEMKIN